METDCGSNICHIEFKLLPSCHLYVKTPGTNCSIPCFLEECKRELHFNIRCPVILCYPKTTTTTMIPTTTISPMPDQCSSALCISSVVFNALFIVLFVLCGLWVYNGVKRFRTARNYQGNDEERPIVRNSRPSARNSSETLDNAAFDEIRIDPRYQPEPEPETGSRVSLLLRSALRRTNSL